MSIPLSSDSIVTLTPANAVGAVTYTANQSWVTFSGNVATLRPTATGTYSVIITARDSLGRTAAVTLRVTVFSSTPASGDIKPDSGDIKPVSPDIKPSSQDIPVPAGSEDITPSGNEPVSVMPTAPSINIKDTAVIQKILNILRSPTCCCISGDTEIAELPEESVGGERSLEDVSEEDLASIHDDETPAAILPIIRVNKPAVYVFGVDLSNMDSGEYIFLHVMPEAAAEQTDECPGGKYTFLDDYGNETEAVPTNKHVNIAVYMKPEYTYAPIITTGLYNSGRKYPCSCNNRHYG